MPEYTQEGRPFRLETPLGTDVLLLVRWSGEEYVSQLYQFNVEAWSTDPDIDVKKLLLKPVTIVVELAGNKKRKIGGIVSRFVNEGRNPYGLTSYHLEIVPAHWLLTIGTTFEIFQEMVVPKIIGDVLTGFDFRKELNDSYKKRQYCFQYRESKWAFVSRLMEQEGIWYKFDHNTSPPTLIMASSNSSSQPEWGLSDIHATRAEHVEERLTGCYVEHAPYVGKTQTRTYSEFLSRKDLKEESSAVASNGRFKPPASLVDYVFDQQMGSHRQGVTLGGSDQPSDVQELFPENKRNALIRQEAEETKGLRLRATSNYRGLTAGAKVSLSRHSSSSHNGDWMILGVRHRGDNGGYLAGHDAEAEYANEFEALPHDVPFRPLRVTPWPRVSGTHVGVVVGPKGEEIYPDKFGRVQVAFRFNDDYEDDLKHSCWVRMAQVFAGPTYGSVFLPRIGHEVLVDFLDGNPDNPVIIGQLYSDHNMPPWKLPENKTQTGFRTRSTLKGASDEHNELRFEDKKESEQIWVQAQKDLDTLVKNNETRKVTKDRTTEIGENDTRTVKKGKDTHTVEEGDQINTVSKGNQTNEVTGGNQTVKIGKSQTTTIKEDQSVTVESGNMTVKVQSGKVSIDAAQAIELKVGASSLKIGPAGIELKAATIKLQADALIETKSPLAKIESSGVLILKGSVTMIN